jgi:hypothetical protein
MQLTDLLRETLSVDCDEVWESAAPLEQARRPTPEFAAETDSE